MRNFLVGVFWRRGNSPTSQGKVTSWCFQHVQPFIFLDLGVSFPSQVFKNGSLRDILYIMSTPLPVNSDQWDYYIFTRESRTKPSFATFTGRVVDPKVPARKPGRLRPSRGQATNRYTQRWKKAWLFRVFVGIINSQLCGDYDKTTIRIPIKQPGWLMERGLFFSWLS